VLKSIFNKKFADWFKLVNFVETSQL